MTVPVVDISFVLNGEPALATIEPRELLIDVLREKFGLTGAKRSCDIGVCGACTVLVDGLPASSCSMLAVDAEGRKVTTIEGLGSPQALDPVQQAFIEHGAMQCGFCTPGMVLAVKGLLALNASPTEEEIRHFLRGNLCRCTGYVKIIEAVVDLAQRKHLGYGRDRPEAFDAKFAAGEAGGAAQIWLANHLFQRDPVALAARVLGATTRMRVALMAMSPFTVHPVQAAMAAATLDEYYPGRVTLCYGVGAPVDLESVGLAAAKPLRPMREALEISRALLAGEAVKREGRTFRVRGRGLATGARRVPIVLAASGPQMLELAGAAADGVLISASSSVEFVRWCMEHVRRGAAGRNVRASGLVYASVDADRAEAEARVRRMLAITLRGEHHRLNLELAGTNLDQAALRAAAARDDWAAAESLISGEVVARHAAAGDAAGVRARFAQYHAAGLDEVVIAGARDGAQIAALLAAVQPVL